MRKTATGSLEHMAIFKKLRDAIALQCLASRFFPFIDQKSSAVTGRYGRE
jgi:hypothetical protein